jgi:hypothetical protein
MKYLILMLLVALPIVGPGAQGVSAEGTSEDGVASEGITYQGEGTVQDEGAATPQESTADGGIKLIDVLDSDAEVKDKPTSGSKKGK